jgi:hypothetical protein
LDSRAFQWFLRLWAVAAFAHFVGNPPTLRIGSATTALTLASLGTALAALAVLVRPNLRAPVAALGVLQVVTAVLEAPILGNHMVITALVALVLLAALTQPDAWAAFAPGGRAVILICYSFAAFAKLNSGFFDPTTSCAVIYGNRWLEGFHLPTLTPGGTLALVPIWLTTVVELLVPALILLPGTRRFGVALGFAFHFALSFDLQQHIYDFTALLFALFSLFLPDSVLQQLGDLPRPRRPRPVWLALGLTAAAFVAAAAVPAEEGSYWLLKTGAFLVWTPWAVWLLWRTVRAALRSGPAQPLGRPGLVALAVMAVAFFNGLTPYLELKTASGYNMYANLVTANGDSNHFVIRRTAHLTQTQKEPFVVLSTPDEGLSKYVDAGWAIPQERLLHYLAVHPDAEVTVTRLGRDEQQTLTSRDGVALPWWKERFQLFRSLDVGSPARCQLHWLPAY